MRAVRFTILLVLPLAAGCKFARFEDRPVLNERLLAERPPRSLAIAPASNRSRFKPAAELLRPRLYAAFAPLGFGDVELARTDDFLNATAMRLNVPPADLSRSEMADPDLADAMLFARVERTSRLFLLFYSRLLVELDLRIVDCRSQEEIYSNRLTVRNRQVSPPTSIWGIATGFVTALWHIREEEMAVTLDQASREAARRLRENLAEASARLSPLGKVEVSVPRPLLIEGDSVTVRVKAPPEAKLTFSIGEIAKDVPLSPGPEDFHAGSYKIKAGDNARYAYVAVRGTLPDHPGILEARAAGDSSFGIDTEPPPPHEVGSWRMEPGGVRLFLRPENLSGDASREVVSYHVYRGKGRGGTLALIGSSNRPEFMDTTALPGVEYEYAIVARDAAGNAGNGQARSLLTFGAK